MKRAIEAERRFRSGFNCAQSVLIAFSNDIGMDERTAARIAAPFGGGMGRRCQTCGAVTGGLMVLGLLLSNGDPNNKETKDLVLKKTQEFMDGFQKRQGSINCKDLIGLDLGTDEGQAEAGRKDLFHTKCPDFVRTSVEILEETLNGKQ